MRAQITAESEARANTVIRQFEWAVNDVASLRAKLMKAEEDVREHTQHAFVAEREMRRLEREMRRRDRRFAVNLVKPAAFEIAPAPAALEIADGSVISLRCALNDEGPLPWLDLSSDDPNNLPSRVRVFERGGNVICVSDPAVHGVAHDGEAHSALLKLPLPPELAGAARRGALEDYHFEALVAHRWVGVRFQWVRAGVYRDKRGRAYRRG